MDDDDERFADTLQHFIDHPEDRIEDFDRFVQTLLLDPRYYQNLVERVKRDDAATLDMLLPHARDPRQTKGRAFARKVLSEAWKDEDAIH